MSRVEIIAEVSSNHGGDMDLAKRYIHACAKAGADWVKFQSYQVKTLRPNDPQYDWLKQAELSDKDHEVLIQACKDEGTKFLTTVFHASRVLFLKSLNLEAIKIGSGESSEWALIDAVVAAGFSRVFASTNKDKLPNRADWTWLRCISYYPTEDWMIRPALWRYDGWSDHCRGIEQAKRAIYDGASVIEKHVWIREDPRDLRPWEADMMQLGKLRRFADDSPDRFIGRWQHAPQEVTR